MLNSTQRVCVLLLAAACATSACNRRTVVRQRTPIGEEPSEVTVSSPETAKSQKNVVVTEPAPAPAPTREVVVVRPSEPPPPPVEATRPVSPAPDYIWVPGAYDWRGSSWEWVPGHWEHPAQPAMVWEPGRWESVPGGYVWKPGHWR
jgi:WXXGXW repeat (2 copies)